MIIIFFTSKLLNSQRTIIHLLHCRFLNVQRNSYVIDLSFGRVPNYSKENTTWNRWRRRRKRGSRHRPPFLSTDRGISVRNIAVYSACTAVSSTLCIRDMFHQRSYNRKKEPRWYSLTELVCYVYMLTSFKLNIS